MTTTSVEIKSAGPAGATGVVEQPSAPSGPKLQRAHFTQSVKVRLASFMLEDYLDSVAARHALNDPENAEGRVPWQQLKDQLGL